MKSKLNCDIFVNSNCDELILIKYCHNSINFLVIMESLHGFQLVGTSLKVKLLMLQKMMK